MTKIMTKNKIRVICIVMVLTMAVLGVVAFADGAKQSQEMAAQETAGIDIEQIELERDAAGNLVPFTQNKKLLPAVYSETSFPTEENTAGFWTGVENAVDKYVTVQNTGSTAAYFRTVIAIESDEENYPGYLIKFNLNTSDYNWNAGIAPTTNYGNVSIIENVHINYQYDSNNDGTLDSLIDDEFDIIAGTYKTELAANSVPSAPSLLQVAMDKNAAGKYVDQFGDTFEILVYTQAVQKAYVNESNTLIPALGGTITRDNHPWTN